MNRKQVSWLLAAWVSIVALSGTARALDPREALGAPAGTSFIQFFDTHNQGGNYWVNGTKISDNAPFTANSEACRFGHFWGAGKNKTFLVAAIFPYYTNITVKGAPVGNQQVSVAGLNDATALFALWPWADWKNQQWLAAVVWVTAPTGDYDNTRLLNVGRNVWTFRSELAWVKGWGPFYLQLVTDLYFDTDNRKYGPAARTLERDVLFIGEIHASYNLTPKFWVGLSWYYANGYRSRIKETGAYNNDGQRDQTFGLSMNYALSKNLSLLVSSKLKAVTNNGFDQAEVFRLKLTYAY